MLVIVPDLSLLCGETVQGINLFRMARDDAFLRSALRYISRLWHDHALPGCPPPPDAWCSEQAYQVSLCPATL